MHRKMINTVYFGKETSFNLIRLKRTFDANNGSLFVVVKNTMILIENKKVCLSLLLPDFWMFIVVNEGEIVTTFEHQQNPNWPAAPVTSFRQTLEITYEMV